ncbi:MAG: MFS transporter, partial [Burkholderiales bacterium]|nr:MFS transporter [Burkholderiales bacterium]
MTAALHPPCDKAAIRHGPPASPCSPATQRWVLTTAILGSSMSFIDGTVVNVALPAIQNELHATLHQVQWVVESYALLLAALLLLGGALGDRYGRRRVFLLGVAIFGAASVLCALSRNVNALIAARALQGVGAALLVPGSLALISASFGERERGQAIGTWAGFSGITAAVGPVIGGWLIDHYSWTWAFLVNAPLAALVAAMAMLRVPESRDPRATGRLDWPGAALVTVGLGGIVFAFIEGPARQWASPAVAAALAIGVVAMAAFAWTEWRVERKGAQPMMPLQFFRDPIFAGANGLTLLVYAALGGGLFFVPLALIQVHGLSAAAAGAALLPFILIMFVLSRWAGGLADRVGPRKPLAIGPVIAGAGFAALALPSTEASYWTGFLPGIVVLGVGMSVTVAPLTTAVMNAAGADAAGIASGINNAVSRAAGVLAVAALGALMAWAFGAALEGQLNHHGVPAAVASLVLEQQGRLAAIELPRDMDAATRAAAQSAIHEAFISGYRWVMWASAALCVLGAAVAA